MFIAFLNGSELFGKRVNSCGLFSVVSTLLSNEQKYVNAHTWIKQGSLAPSCETILQHKVIVTIMFIAANNNP